MALTWKLTGTWDLTIQNGKLATITSADEVRQRVLITLQHYWQEYFLNVPAGLPWYEFILGSKDKKTVGAIIRQAILGVPGVYGIVNFQLSLQNRAVTVYADLETDYGIVSITLGGA